MTHLKRTALTRTTAIRQVQDSNVNQELKDRTSDFLFGCLFLCRTKVEGAVSVNPDGTEIVLDWEVGNKVLTVITGPQGVHISSSQGPMNNEPVNFTHELVIPWEEVRGLDPRLTEIWRWLMPSMAYDFKCD